jgi:hypothetical protein
MRLGGLLRGVDRGGAVRRRLAWPMDWSVSSRMVARAFGGVAAGRAQRGVWIDALAARVDVPSG